jgi:carbohydrate-selective porin OprB
MILRTAVVLIALLVSSAAQSHYLTYQQWQAMPEAARNAYLMGAFDGWQATGWMNLKFDAQYVINPGGRGFNAAGVKTDNAFVLGMRTEVHF